VISSEKVCVVTGGGAGIGRACVHRFSGEGYRVLLGDMSKEDGEKTLTEINDTGGEALFRHGDVSDDASCRDWAETALTQWGRIDTLVANAGARVYGSILDATDEEWEKILAVNLRGVARCCKAVLPVMIEQGSGSIVIISSANALVGRADMPLYDATKAAVLSLVRSLAVAHGKDGIRVNGICPGFTVTDFHERRADADGVSPEQLRNDNQGYALLGRPAEPREIASAVYFLAGEDAAMITGQTLMVDAGFSVTAGR